MWLIDKYPIDDKIRIGRKVQRYSETWKKPYLPQPIGIQGTVECEACIGTVVAIQGAYTIIDCNRYGKWKFLTKYLKVVHSFEDMTDEEYCITLKLLYNYIESGHKLVRYNCNVIGNKDMYVNWGMCSNSNEIYLYGRPKRQHISHFCPLDKNPEEGRWGCFYRCKLWDNYYRSQENPITRDDVLKLYKVRIGEVEDGNSSN